MQGVDIDTIKTSIRYNVVCILTGCKNKQMNRTAQSVAKWATTINAFDHIKEVEIIDCIVQYGITGTRSMALIKVFVSVIIF